MNLFETTGTIMVLNKKSQTLDVLEKGTVVKPNTHRGDLCDIIVNKTLYEMTVDTFKEFFVLSSKKNV